MAHNEALAAQKAEEVKNIRNRVMGLAAKRYAAADRTDPFAYARAMSHLRSGVAQYSVDDGRGNEVAAYYDAEGYREGREYEKATGEVVKYEVQAWRKMVRP
jgi:hypothetical protein